jgi:hypothetical protein
MPKKNPSSKTYAKKRTVNPPEGQPQEGAPFRHQDPERRLGNYQGKGEHARQMGSRKK